MKHVNVEEGEPSAVLEEGDVWKVRLPGISLLGPERYLKILKINENRVRLMEVPHSNMSVEYSIVQLGWIEKIPQE